MALPVVPPPIYFALLLLPSGRFLSFLLSILLPSAYISFILRLRRSTSWLRQAVLEPSRLLSFLSEPPRPPNFFVILRDIIYGNLHGEILLRFLEL